MENGKEISLYKRKQGNKVWGFRTTSRNTSHKQQEYCLAAKQQAMYFSPKNNSTGHGNIQIKREYNLKKYTMTRIHLK